MTCFQLKKVRGSPVLYLELSTKGTGKQALVKVLALGWGHRYEWTKLAVEQDIVFADPEEWV